VGLLGRLRSNAGTRLPSRSGDEEEFVPKSVVAARAVAAARAVVAARAVAAAELAAITAAAAPTPVAAAPTPVAAPVAAPAATPPRATPVEAARHRFVPHDVPFETEPPPTALPGSTPQTLEAALLQAEEAELERVRVEATAQADLEDAPPATPRSEQGDEAPSIEMGDSAELELDLFDPFDEPTATGAPDEIESMVLESDVPPPRLPPVTPPRLPPAPPPRQPPAPPPAPVPPAAPASATRAIPMRASPTIESRAITEHDPPLVLPPRKLDPLARTAQNPIPAAFERAVLRAEGTRVPALHEGLSEGLSGALDASASARGNAPSSPDLDSDEPVSSKQPRDLDREGGELDGPPDSQEFDEESPQSGEIESQRQPTSAHARDLDLDGATPSSDQSEAVASEAMALLEAEALTSAPPPTQPTIMGRRPLASTAFIDVLDAALSLAE